MRFSFSRLRTRAGRSAWLLTAVAALAAAGCSPATRPAATAGKDNPTPTAARRQSEYDYYCTLRPTSSASGSVAGYRPFAPAVYGAMKARGYKVYLVRYRYERPADSPWGVGRAFVGYGFRDLFGSGPASGATARKTFSGQRAAVVWETRRGEFFLVDRYYAPPLWLDGATWLEKVRFYDPAAVSVELDKS